MRSGTEGTFSRERTSRLSPVSPNDMRAEFVKQAGEKIDVELQTVAASPRSATAARSRDDLEAAHFLNDSVASAISIARRANSRSRARALTVWPIWAPTWRRMISAS